MLIQKFIKSQFYLLKSPNLIKLGFDFNKDITTEYLKIQSMLYTEYHIKCESMLTIMKKFNIPSSRTMDIVFRLFDIEARSFSEAGINALEQGRKEIHSPPTYVHVYHETWFGDVVLLRSSHEIDYAKILDESKIKYFVETLRIKYFDKKENRYRIAVPDFYLPDTNAIVEVKSDYWLNINQMKDKRESYLALGYKFHLFLDHQFIENW